MTPLEQVLVALRYYATGSMQLVIADTGHLSQPSISRAVTAVTDALANISEEYIRMPETRQEIHEVNISTIQSAKKVCLILSEL
jgi:hypothetical protein